MTFFLYTPYNGDRTKWYTDKIVLDKMVLDRMVLDKMVCTNKREGVSIAEECIMFRLTLTARNRGLHRYETNCPAYRFDVACILLQLTFVPRL